MNDRRTSRRGVAARGFVLAALAVFVYLLIGGGFRFQFRQTPFAHHVLVADGMLHGYLHVRPETTERMAKEGEESARAALRAREIQTGEKFSPEQERQGVDWWVRYRVFHDWSVVDGKLYGYWAPLAPALMVPWVAALGPGVSDVLVDALFGALNVGLFYCFLRRVDRSGFLRLSESCCTALTLLLAFGTVSFYLSCMGRVWFAVQVVTLTATLAACVSLASSSLAAWRSLLAGAFFGAAFLGRNFAALLGLFFVAVIWLQTRGTTGVRVRATALHVGLFLLPCLAAVGLQGWYNYERFGSVGEDGLAIQLVTSGDPRFVSDYREYGLFSPHYLARNLKYYFWNFELPRTADGGLTIDLGGNSMFLVTPPLVFAFLAWRSRAPIVLAAAAGVVPFVGALLICWSTGYSQFGTRYLLEAMPFLLLLVGAGMNGRLSHAGYLLIVLAIASNLFGAYRYGDEYFVAVDPYVGWWTLPAFVALALAARVGSTWWFSQPVRAEQ